MALAAICARGELGDTFCIRFSIVSAVVSAVIYIRLHHLRRWPLVQAIASNRTFSWSHIDFVDVALGPRPD